MFQRPALSQAAIALSPAAIDGLSERKEAFAASGAALPVRLFITGAEKAWPEFLADSKRFKDGLRPRGYLRFSYRWRPLGGGRHAVTKAESYNRGIRLAFGLLALEE